MTYIIFLISAFVLSLFGTKKLLALLTRWQALDVPNSRSNHTCPTPRGGGISVIFTFLLLLVMYSILSGEDSQPITGIVVCCSLLALVSFVDDIRSLPAISRLAAQVVAVAISMYGFKIFDGFIFQGLLPAWLDAVATALLWLWFINLYNFMDGIDGITAVETSSITLGIFLVGVFSAIPTSSMMISVILLGSVLGFAVLNWHPAKIFMGDVGSIPLGFVLGYLLLNTAAQGYPVVALIIPAYYLFDSGFTLVSRILRKQNILKAHSDHFYQKAVRSGKSHATVATAIAIANVALITTAVITIIYDTTVLSLSLSVIIVGLLIACFLRKKVHEA